MSKIKKTTLEQQASLPLLRLPPNQGIEVIRTSMVTVIITTTSAHSTKTTRISVTLSMKLSISKTLWKYPKQCWPLQSRRIFFLENWELFQNSKKHLVVGNFKLMRIRFFQLLCQLFLEINQLENYPRKKVLCSKGLSIHRLRMNLINSRISINLVVIQSKQLEISKKRNHTIKKI